MVHVVRWLTVTQIKDVGQVLTYYAAVQLAIKQHFLIFNVNWKFTFTVPLDIVAAPGVARKHWRDMCVIVEGFLTSADLDHWPSE